MGGNEEVRGVWDLTTISSLEGMMMREDGKVGSWKRDEVVVMGNHWREIEVEVVHTCRGPVRGVGCGKRCRWKEKFPVMFLFWSVLVAWHAVMQPSTVWLDGSDFWIFDTP